MTKAIRISNGADAIFEVPGYGTDGSLDGAMILDELDLEGYLPLVV
jgi:hypothetical protein